MPSSLTGFTRGTVPANQIGGSVMAAINLAHLGEERSSGAAAAAV